MTIARQNADNDLARWRMSKSPEKKRMRSPSELQSFESIFPELVEVLTAQKNDKHETILAMDWFREVCEYNVPFGKKNRGLTVVESYRHLVDNPSDEEIKTAQVVGWMIEWLQAFFLVADDVMDQSETRRGKPCWYKQDKVGLEAINDAFFLESAVYILLKKYCKGKSYYLNLLELFHETTHQTITGQCLDMLASGQTEKPFERFTMDTYKAIVKYKTAFYSFYLPVACAMYMSGIEDETIHFTAKTILLKMGEFFQIQDDYLDCYGNPAVTGKIGTDIQDNKCSWLVVQALSKANDQQTEVLKNHYGKDEKSSIEKVKEVFEQLDVRGSFLQYEEDSYCHLVELISELPNQLPQAMFQSFAQKIYKRQK